MNHPLLGATPTSNAQVRMKCSEKITPVAECGQPWEGGVRVPSILGVDSTAIPSSMGMAKRKSVSRSMHGENLVVGFQIHEHRLGRCELYAGQHAEHAGDPKGPAKAVAMNRRPID